MPGVQLGFLKFVLGLETLSFNKGATEAEARIKSLQRSMQGTADKLAGLGAKLSIGLTAPLASFAASGIKEAQETAAAMAQVNAALASMGPVAGRTAAQLSDAADSFEGSSLFEADEILKKVTANMLTFGNVAGANFDKAQQAAINLSARMGTDLQASAILVGKALNDPVKGLTSLSRAGIQFSASQKETIKSMVEGGNAAGAQAIIRAELDRQYRNAAKAAQDADPYNTTTDAWKKASEALGKALLPLIPPLTAAITGVATAFSNLSPATQKWVIIIGGVAAAMGPTLIGFSVLFSASSKLLPLIVKLGAAAGLLGKGFLSSVGGILSAGRALLLLVANPFVLGAALLIGGIYLAWKNWDKITAIVRNLYIGAKTWLMDKLGAVFAWVKGKLTGVGDWFHNLYDRVVGHSYIPDMVEGIAVEMAKLQAVMVAPAQRTTKAAGDAFKALQERVGGILADLFPEAAAANEFQAKLADITAALKAQAIGADTAAAAIARLKTQYSERGVNVVGLSSPLDPGAAQTPLVPNQGGAGVGNAAAALGPVSDGMARLQAVADSAGEAVTRALGGIPDLALTAQAALAEISERGLNNLVNGLGAVVAGSAKLGDVFRDTINGMIQDISRYLIKEALIKLIGFIAGGTPSAGSFGGKLVAGLSGARASGGPISAGGTYLVGERGPELFTSSRGGGTIIPNGKFGSRASGHNFSIYVTAPNTGNPSRDRQTSLQHAAAIKAEINRSTARGF